MWLAVFTQQIQTLIALLNDSSFRNDPMSQRYVCKQIGELLQWVSLYGPRNTKKGTSE